MGEMPSFGTVDVRDSRVQRCRHEETRTPDLYRVKVIDLCTARAGSLAQFQLSRMLFLFVQKNLMIEHLSGVKFIRYLSRGDSHCVTAARTQHFSTYPSDDHVSAMNFKQRGGGVGDP